MSLKEVLREYLSKNGDWVSKGYLTNIQWYRKNKTQYLPETVGRKLRELEMEGVIAVKDEGISVQYKYIPSSIRSRYIPWSLRKEKNILFNK